jgi:RNA polymerase sigma factor (sigma-70 family)
MQEVVKMRAHNRRHRQQEWDDAQLIEAAVAGDSVAADILFSRYDGYAWKVAIHYTHSHQAAEEAVAAGRASAFEKMSQLRDPTRFGPWLAALVKNSAFTEHRRSSRMVPSGDLPDVAFLEDDTEAESTDAERFDRARKALLSLPERHRQAIDMAVFNELPVKEVAASLMIDVNTAYQLLYRARKNLRRAYISTRPHAGATAACRACATKTLDYLRGNVEVREEVDAHVATCVGCRTLLAEALDDAREMQPLFGLAPVGLVVAWRELARRHPRLIRRPRIRHAAVGSPVTASVCVVAAVALVAGVTGYAVAGHNAPTRFINAGATGPPPAGPVSAHGHNGGSGGGGGQSSAQGPSSSSTTPTTSGPFVPTAHPLVTVPAATTTITAPPVSSTTVPGSSSVYPASVYPAALFPAAVFPASVTGNPTTFTPAPVSTTPTTLAPPTATTSPTTAAPTTTVAPPPARPWTTTPVVDAGSHPGHHTSHPAPPTTTTTPPTTTPPTTTPPTTTPPTTTPPTTTPPTTTTTLPPPTPRPGVYLTGDGTTSDSGTVGADATPTGTVPTSLYGPDTATGEQAFAFDGANGLSADIPSLLAQNFTVSFDLNTSQPIPTGGGIDLLGQRASCSLSNFFDVRLDAPTPGSGDLIVELDQPTSSGGATDLATSFALNDGQWHRIQITRVGQTVDLYVDGVLADIPQSLPSATTSIGIPRGDAGYIPWEVAAGDPCVGKDGTMNLDGEMANIFVGPSASAPAAKLP